MIYFIDEKPKKRNTRVFNGNQSWLKPRRVDRYYDEDIDIEIYDIIKVKKRKPKTYTLYI